MLEIVAGGYIALSSYHISQTAFTCLLILLSMINLRVYEGEVFTRPKRRYVIMLTIMILLIVLSLIQGLQLLNVVIIVILGAAYTLYSLRNSHPTSMEITEKGLRIKDAVYPRDELNGFVVELTRDTHDPHNIVIIKNNNLHLIHTIIDHDNVHDFITTLSDIIPMLSSFDQTFSEKLMRRMMV